MNPADPPPAPRETAGAATSRGAASSPARPAVFLRTQPRSHLAVLYAYWEVKRGTRWAPSPRDIDPI